LSAPRVIKRGFRRCALRLVALPSAASVRALKPGVAEADETACASPAAAREGAQRGERATDGSCMIAARRASQATSRLGREGQGPPASPAPASRGVVTSTDRGKLGERPVRHYQQRRGAAPALSTGFSSAS